MISNADAAEQISELMLDIFRRLDESVTMVQKVCAPEDALQYRKSIGKVIYPVLFDLLEPLYDQQLRFSGRSCVPS
jgi:hypothetical protein